MERGRPAYKSTSGNPVYCVAPHSKMLIYLNKLRFSRFGDALSTGFAEVAITSFCVMQAPQALNVSNRRWSEAEPAAGHNAKSQLCKS